MNRPHSHILICQNQAWKVKSPNTEVCEFWGCSVFSQNLWQHFSSLLPMFTDAQWSPAPQTFLPASHTNSALPSLPTFHCHIIWGALGSVAIISHQHPSFDHCTCKKYSK